MDTKIKLRSLVLSLSLSLGVSANAYAAGFALIEMNASGQGNAYAGAAAFTNNASTVYFNPAGMMNLEGEQLAIASHIIDPSSDFENDGSSLSAALGGTDLHGKDDDGGETAFVPNFYWVKPLGDDMSFGLGFNSPFGLKTEYDDDWRGRYHGILSDLKTININPSLGYRVNDKLSVGGGLNVMMAEVDLSNAVDFGTICVSVGTLVDCINEGATPETADGKAELEGDNFDDIGLGFNLGLTYQVTKQTRIGLAYRSEVDLEVDGDAEFTVPNIDAVNDAITNLGALVGGPIFVDTGLSAEVTVPESFSVSLAHQVGKVTWLADITWTGWSSFDELRVEFDNTQPDSVTTENWDDSMRYSIGFDYQYSDKMILRAGVALDETPIPDAEHRTPRLPGEDRTWLSLGLTYMTNDKFSFDVGYSHLFVEDAEIDNEFESSIPSLRHTLTGEYEGEVDILSAQLNWKID